MASVCALRWIAQVHQVIVFHWLKSETSLACNFFPGTKPAIAEALSAFAESLDSPLPNPATTKTLRLYHIGRQGDGEGGLSLAAAWLRPLVNAFMAGATKFEFCYKPDVITAFKWLVNSQSTLQLLQPFGASAGWLLSTEEMAELSAFLEDAERDAHNAERLVDSYWRWWDAEIDAANKAAATSSPTTKKRGSRRGTEDSSDEDFEPPQSDFE